MIATQTPPGRDWRVVVRVKSERRARKAWPTLADADATAAGDEPVVDVVIPAWHLSRLGGFANCRQPPRRIFARAPQRRHRGRSCQRRDR